MRGAIINAGAVFASPRQLQGRPAQAAVAVAQMEFLATEMPGNVRFNDVPANLQDRFRQARDEWRAALGIPADKPAQPVIDSLYAASRALRSGQPDLAAASLPASVFPQGGEAAILRLASLPSLPLTNQAAVAATETLRRHEGQGRGRF